MGFLGSRQANRSSREGIVYETDFFRIAFPSNWTVVDREGVLNANAPENAFLTASAKLFVDLTTHKLREEWLMPTLQRARLECDAVEVAYNNWRGWRGEGTRKRLRGWLGGNWLMCVVAYRSPIVVVVIAATSELSLVAKMKPYFETCVESLLLAEDIVVAGPETTPSP